MNTNLCICRNEVIIEGESVGQFETFEIQGNNKTLGVTGHLTLPLYAIGSGDTSGRATARIRNVFEQRKVIPCAKIEVFCWYDGMEKTLVFTGFIENIAEGFPAKIYVRDNSYILRYGNIQKGWTENATLQKIMKDLIPVAQDAFQAERDSKGLTFPIPKLTYSTEERNVQAITSSLSFRNWGARSPFDTVQKLMQLLVLYGGVSDDYNAFVGAGVRDNTAPIVKLDTRYNVIDRDIVPLDGRFVDYDVKITGILSNGKQYTATGGYGTSRDRSTRSGFDKTYGESYRGFTPLNTPKSIQDFADKMLEMLKAYRNKGKITLLLYPKLQVFDWITYNDTVFPELSSGYYVLDYAFKASSKGFYQQIGVTDQIYAF